MPDPSPPSPRLKATKYFLLGLAMATIMFVVKDLTNSPGDGSTALTASGPRSKPTYEPVGPGRASAHGGGPRRPTPDEPDSMDELIDWVNAHASDDRTTPPAPRPDSAPVHENRTAKHTLFDSFNDSIQKQQDAVVHGEGDVEAFPELNRKSQYEDPGFQAFIDHHLPDTDQGMRDLTPAQCEAYIDRLSERSRRTTKFIKAMEVKAEDESRYRHMMRDMTLRQQRRHLEDNLNLYATWHAQLSGDLVNYPANSDLHRFIRSELSKLHRWANEERQQLNGVNEQLKANPSR